MWTHGTASEIGGADFSVQCGQALMLLQVQGLIELDSTEMRDGGRGHF